jgi:hypothetical protein
MIGVAIPCLPRSGSSMTAGIVHHLGFDMGPPGLARPDRNNPRGYFEDWRFSRFHRWRSARENVAGDEFRRRLRMPPEDPRLADDEWARYRRLVRACEARGGNWGVKDPELTYYLPRLLEAAAGPVRLVIPVRPFEEVVASVAAALGHPAADARRAIAEYGARLATIADDWRPAPTLIVGYHDVLRDPGREVARIAEFLGVRPTLAAIAFVNPGLRRHRVAPGATPGPS